MEKITLRECLRKLMIGDKIDKKWKVNYKILEKRRIVAIDIGASNEGVSLFKKLFDELELESGKTEMLEEVKSLYGFRRDKNKYFISKSVKEIKTDIFVLRNTYNNYWENTDLFEWIEHLWRD